MSDDDSNEEHTRRDFLTLVSVSSAAVATGVAIWPFIDSMNPAGDVLALASVEVDLSGIEEGQSITVKWRGKPVFIRHRTEEEINASVDTPLSDLPDPQLDSDRATKPEWLVVVGVCTHLGCIPLGQKSGDNKGEYNGWFCPCHGSHYDTSGRIRKGPAPTNLPIPQYSFISESSIKIG